jgi:peptidoglycan/LPS O-acetylase OafA/YrhL
MYFYFNLQEAKKLSSVKFWATIFFITPIVIFTSFLLYKYIEKPFMNFSKRINYENSQQKVD